MTYELLLAAGPWRPLPGCPGRSAWRGDRETTPAALVGRGTPVHVFEVEGARDPVHVAVVFGGGLISYRNPDGRFVHTLNTPEGLERKLIKLGIVLPGSGDIAGPAAPAVGRPRRRSGCDE